MNNTIRLEPASLYILSGVENSGKRTLLKNNNIEPDLVVDIEDIKGKYLGCQPRISEHNKIVYTNYQLENDLALDILKNIVVMRMKQGLTTFVVAPFLTDHDREPFVRLANKFNTHCEVLIMTTDEDEIMDLNRDSKFYIKESVLMDKISIFESISRFPYRLVSTRTQINISLNEISTSNFDVVGDVHGFYDEFVELISKKGYYIENETIKHPKNRKILLLGDFLDKGDDSVKMLNLVYNSVKNEGHMTIMGNHEYKVLHMLSEYLSSNRINPRNISNSVTVSDILRTIPISKVKRFVKFLKSIPIYLTYKKYAFVHADITHFDPLHTPKANLIFGDSKKGDDNDNKYQKLYELGLNKYTIFRGHTSGTNNWGNVFSLEDKNSLGGKIYMLDFKSFLEDTKKSGNIKSFNKNIKSILVTFNVEERQDQVFRIKKIANLKSSHGVSYLTNKTGILTVFNVSKNNIDDAYYRNKCFDFVGNIILVMQDGSDINISYNPYENNKLVIVADGQFFNSKISHFIKSLGPLKISKVTKILKREGSGLSVGLSYKDGKYIVDGVTFNDTSKFEKNDNLLSTIKKSISRTI